MLLLYSYVQLFKAAFASHILGIVFEFCSKLAKTVTTKIVTTETFGHKHQFSKASETIRKLLGE